MWKARLLLMVWLTIFPTNALIGYDCGTNSLNVTTISLLDIDHCHIEPEDIKTTMITMYLLQLNQYDHIEINQCKVEITRTVYYCGMHSHVSIVSNAYMEYIQPISREACNNIHNHGTIQIGNAIINSIKENATTTHSLQFAGKLTSDGACEGADYADPYGSWGGVVVIGMVKISVQKKTARVHMDSNQVILSSQTVCGLSTGACLDPEGGHTFWNPVPNHDACSRHRYTALYKGIGQKIEAPDGIVYTVTTQETSFALTQTGTTHSCGMKLYKTEHPKIFIKETLDQMDTINNHVVALNVDNMDIFMYVNTKFLYVEKHIKQQVKNLYLDVLEHRCQLEKKILKNSLAIAATMPDEFAFRFMRGPGYMAVLAGEAIHIIQCIPVEVKIRHASTCYTHLPVLRGNESYFLTPRTRILVNQATEIPCNAPLLQYYRLAGTWYKLTPKPIETVAPTNVQPNARPRWEYKNPTNLATSGVYTEEDIEQMKDRIMFPMERPSVLNTIAQKAAGSATNPKPPVMYNLLDEESLQKLAENAWNRTWGRFIQFGSISAGLLGIYLMFRTFKMLIDTVIHGYALHSVYGWSIHLVGAIWSSLTHLLLHLGRKAQNLTVEHVGELENRRETTVEILGPTPPAPPPIVTPTTLPVATTTTPPTVTTATPSTITTATPPTVTLSAATMPPDLTPATMPPTNRVAPAIPTIPPRITYPILPSTSTYPLPTQNYTHHPQY